MLWSHPPPCARPWLITVVRMTVGVSHHIMGCLHMPATSHSVIKDKRLKASPTGGGKGRKEGSGRGGRKGSNSSLVCQLLFAILSSLQQRQIMPSLFLQTEKLLGVTRGHSASKWSDQASSYHSCLTVVTCSKSTALVLKVREHRASRSEWNKVPGGRRGSLHPGGGALQLSALWVEAGWLGSQEMEFEFLWQWLASKGTWVRGKTNSTKQVPAGATWMQSLEYESFCQASPGNGLEEFCYWANGRTVLVVVESSRA